MAGLGDDHLDESIATDTLWGNFEYTGEGVCQRFQQRLETCLRESQQLDVFYDCRSRIIDFKQCTTKHKQGMWAMRQTMVTIQHDKELKKWIRQFDEKMGHPPLLEAVATIRKKLEEEGGVEVMCPSVFKDPDIYIPIPTNSK